MTNKCVVAVKTELPPADVQWTVDLGDDARNGLIYGNLAYDLVAAAVAKLGVEYTKFILGERTEQEMNARLACAFEALKVTD